MAYEALIGVVALLLLATIRRLAAWRQHIAEARASGLPYLISPITARPGYLMGVLDPLIMLIVESIPSLRDSLYPIRFSIHRGFKYAERMRKEIGEVFLIATPWEVYLNSSSAEGNLQITTRRHDFVKPVEMYSIVDLFGPSVLGTEGDEWKRHRKIVGPAFAEKSNLLVWRDSLRQAEGMVNFWSRMEGNTTAEMIVNDPATATAHLALHVISAAGFGVTQLWEGEDLEELGADVVPGFNTFELSRGHRFLFKEALDVLITGVLWKILLPDWLLKISPFKFHRRTLRAHGEVEEYFRELTAYKTDFIDKGNKVDDRIMDIMGPLVKASQNSPEESKGVYLTKQEVIADSWLLMFAGHESSANTLNYTLLLLAYNLPTQQIVQQTADSILSGRHHSTWTYENDMSALYNSIVGACLNESLRLYPPVLEIPKMARPNAQIVTINGKQHPVPKETYIQADTAGVHRNPRYWPHSPSKVSGREDDLEEWIPQRWLPGGAKYQPRPRSKDGKEHDLSGDKETEDTEHLDKPSFVASSSSAMFNPEKGAYIPFAEGPRACPGRRFAQVEIVAVLAYIAKYYSIELDVSKYASYDKLKTMGVDEKREVYEKARRNTERVLKGSTMVIATKIWEKVGLRIIKRGAGNELFDECYRDVV